MRRKKYYWLFAICIIFLLVVAVSISVYAHSGKTDSSGGHRDSDTGEYHYHHGYPAHDHYDMDGDGINDCPYEFDDKTDHSPGNNSGSGSISQNIKPSSNNIATNNKQQKYTFGDVISESFMLCIIAVAIGISSLGIAVYILSCFLSKFLSEKWADYISLIIGWGIALTAIYCIAATMSSFPWPLIILSILAATFFAWLYWDKIKDTIAVHRKVILWIVGSLLALALAVAIIIGLFALVSYIDSPLLYGIIGIIVIGGSVIGFPIYLYRSGSIGYFIAIICLYIFFIILALIQCSA